MASIRAACSRVFGLLKIVRRANPVKQKDVGHMTFEGQSYRRVDAFGNSLSEGCQPKRVLVEVEW